MRWGRDTPSLLMAGPAFLGKVGSVMVSDSADPAMPTPGSAHAIPAGLEDDAICEVHLESDWHFTFLHAW